MVAKKRWLDFVLKHKNLKTDVYYVGAKSDGAVLGEVRWDFAWRHYLFFPTLLFATKHSDGCLIEIAEFIAKLNAQHGK